MLEACAGDAFVSECVTGMCRSVGVLGVRGSQGCWGIEHLNAESVVGSTPRF